VLSHLALGKGEGEGKRSLRRRNEQPLTFILSRSQGRGETDATRLRLCTRKQTQFSRLLSPPQCANRLTQSAAVWESPPRPHTHQRGPDIAHRRSRESGRK